MFGKDKNFEIQDGVLVKGKNATGNVKIPNNVTKIGRYAFASNSKITSIIIPEGVTSIDDFAFMGCKSLKSIIFPASLENLGEECVFFHCDSLKEIKIDSGNKNFKIDSNVIYSYDGKILYNYLKNDCDVFNIPNVVEKIGKRAFSSSKIREVILPESLKSIEDEAFSYCRDLEKINLHDNIEYIGDHAFEDCCLTDVTIPKAVKGINGATFKSCRNIKLSVSPENEYYKMIDGNLYYYSDGSALDENSKNKELSIYLNRNNPSFTIPDGVTGIGKGAFFKHIELKSINIPDSVEYISSESFSNCEYLNNIVLPEKLTSIPKAAFSNCNKLKSINIPSGVKKIGDGAFEYTGLEEVIIPDGVEEIGSGAFFDCNSLYKFIIPESIKVIKSNAFSRIETNLKVTVYCRAKTKPAGWKDDWGMVKVIWGYTGD